MADRSKNYELTARFSAENDTGRTFTAIEKRIDRLEKKMKKLDGMEATIAVHMTGEDKVEKLSDKLDKKINHATRDREVDVTLKQDKRIARQLKDLNYGLTTLTKPKDIRLSVNSKDANRTVSDTIKSMNKSIATLDSVRMRTNAPELIKEAEKLKRSYKEFAKGYQAKLDVVNEKIAIKKLNEVRASADSAAGVKEIEMRLKRETKFNSDLRGIEARMAVLTKEPNLVQVGGNIDDFNRKMARVRERLKRDLDRVYDIEIDANTEGFAEASAKASALASQIRQLSDTKVKIDYNSRGYSEVLVQAGVLKRQLESVDGTYTATLKVNRDANALNYATALKGTLNSLGNSYRSMTPLSEAFARQVYIGQQAMYVFSTAIMAVAIVSLPALIAGLGIAISAFAAFGAGIGIMALAAAPIISQFTGMAERAQKLKTAQDAVATSAKGLATAQDGLRSAQQATADAVSSGADQMASAYKAYDDAQESVVQAQADRAKSIADANRAHEDSLDSLADANDDVKEATADYNDELAQEKYRLQDLRYEMEGLGLDQRELALDITEAKKELAEAETPEDRARAQIQYERLLLREKELASQTRDAQNELNDARLNGTAELQAAEDGLQSAYDGRKDALQGVQDAEAAVVEATVSGNKAVADAQEAAAEAYANIGKTQAEVSKNIANAKANERSAVEAVAAAQKEHNTAVKAFEALQKGQPKYMEPLLLKLSQLKQAYREAFAPATAQMAILTGRMFDMATKTMPYLGLTAEQTGIQFNEAFSNIGEKFGEFGVFDSLLNILSYIPTITQQITEALGGFGGGIINIMSIAMPYAEDFAYWLNEISVTFMRWTDSKDGRDQIIQFFEAAGPILSRLWFWISRAAGALTNLTIKHPQKIINFIDLIAGAIRAVVRTVVWFHDVWVWLGTSMVGGWIQRALILLAKVAIALWFFRTPIMIASKALSFLGRISGFVLSRMGITWFNVGRVIGKYVPTAIHWVVRGLMTALRWVLRLAATPGFLSTAFRTAGTIIVAILGTIGAALGFTGGAAIGVGAAIVTAVVGAVALGITILVGMIRAIMQNFKWLRETWRGLGQMIENGTLTWGEAIMAFARTLAAAAAHTILSGILQPMKTATGLMGHLPGRAGRMMKAVSDGLGSGLDNMRDKWAGSTAGIANDLGKNMKRGSDESTRHLTNANQKGSAQMNQLSTFLAQKSNQANQKVSGNSRQMSNNFLDDLRRLNKGGNQQFGQLSAGGLDKTGKLKTGGMADFNQLFKGGKMSMTDLQAATTNQLGLANKNALSSTGSTRDKGSAALAEFKTRGVDSMGAFSLLSRERMWMAAVDIQNALNAILSGMSKFIDEAGVDTKKPSQIPVQSSPGESAGATRTPTGGNAVAFAKGGTYQQPNGGVSNGATRVYGEVPGTREFYITDNHKYRKRNMGILAEANKHMHGGDHMQPYTDAPGFTQQKHDAQMNASIQELKLAKGGTIDVGSLPANTSYPWQPLVGKAVSAFYKVGVNDVTTYDGHSPSIDLATDVWVGGSTYGVQPSDHDKFVGFANWVVGNMGGLGAEYVIHDQQINTGGGWSGMEDRGSITQNHFDHVHVSFVPGAGGGIVGATLGEFASPGGPSGVGGSGPDYNAMWDRNVEKPKPIDSRHFGVVADAGDAIVTKLYNAAKEATLAKMPASTPGGSYAGGPAPEGSVKEWIKKGFEYGKAFPATEDNMGAMYSRVMQESGGDPNAVNNWDSNAAAGTPSKGLVQIIEPTWEAWRREYGSDTGPFDTSWNDPVMSVATSTRYMKGQYGYVVGANGQGYLHGGLARQPQMGMVGDSGPSGELMWPLDDSRTAKLVQEAVDKGGRARLSGPESLHEKLRTAVLSMVDTNTDIATIQSKLVEIIRGDSTSSGGGRRHSQAWYDKQFKINNANDPNRGKAGYTQAEDGSWVPNSFYSGGGSGQSNSVSSASNGHNLGSPSNVSSQESATATATQAATEAKANAEALREQILQDTLEEIQHMREELIATMRQEMQEIGLDEQTMRRLVQFGAETAFAAMGSQRGLGVMENQLENKLDFDHKLKGYNN